MSDIYSEMIGSERIVQRNGVELTYRVEGIKRRAASRWSDPTVTVFGRCITSLPKEGHPNATWYGSYCSEIFYLCCPEIFNH